MTSIIKVDQIQNAAGVGGLTIDSNGIISTAQRPSFHVYYEASGVVGVGGTIVFTGVRDNTGSHYNTSTGKFVAPVAGLYQFNFSGFGCNSSGGTLSSGSSSVGFASDTYGGNYHITYGYANASHHPNLSFSTSHRLAANEGVYINTGNSYLYQDSSMQYLYFSGYYVG